MKYEGPDNICHNYLDWEVKSDPIPQIVKDTIEQGKGLSGVHLSGMVTSTISFSLLLIINLTMSYKYYKCISDQTFEL